MHVFFFSFLWLLALPSSFADVVFDYESDHSALKVVLPASLKAFAGIEGIRHSQALFGTPSYGGDKKITGQLFYVTPGTLTGCDAYHEQTQNIPSNVHKIFLVDRGDCDFVVKMKTAQQLGAIAVIIADNICQCSSMNLDPALGRTQALLEQCTVLGKKAQTDGRITAPDTCEHSLPFMADDGTGYDVRIPSFLIDYMDAQPFKDCLSAAAGEPGPFLTGTTFSSSCKAEGTSVVVSLEWDLPARDNIVDWQLWSSSDSEAVFKKSFALTAKKLAPNTKFTPHYFIWEGEKWGCTIGEICATQCTKGGYYCNPDPDHNLFNGVSGKDVVEENLREICVWEQADKLKNSGIWWDYVTSFASKCHPGSTPSPDLFNKACSEAVQKTIPNLDPQAVSKCVDDSWYSPTGSGEKLKNKKLDVELRGRDKLKILQLPTAIVNDVLLRGGVTPFTILTSICSGFAAGQSPSLCSCVDRVNPQNVLDCINASCENDQKLCPNDNKCYSPTDYAAACSQCASGLSYCPSIGQCLPTENKCPDCPSTTPSYCSLLQKCVDSPLNCVPPPTATPDASDKGTSAFGVLFITLFVVSIAGCGAYMFWKRQKAKLHDDVRAILSSYMALEETDESDDRVSRAARGRRVEPSPTAVEGQDAATYI